MDTAAHYTNAQFKEAVNILNYGKFLPGTEINFTLPQLIRLMAGEYFILTGNIELTNSQKEAWEIVRQVAREFESRGWFEFKPEVEYETTLMLQG